MAEHQEKQPRIKKQYKQQFTGYKYPYSRSKKALPQNLMKWQSDIEFKKALAEKREEEFNFGRKWTVDAVKDDKVSICSMITGICQTISKTMFSKLFWKKPVKNTTVTVQKGGNTHSEKTQI